MKPTRAVLSGVTAFVTGMCAALIALHTTFTQPQAWLTMGTLLLCAISNVALFCQARSRADALSATLRFSAKQPPGLRWGPGLVAPRDTIAALEGGVLHRRLAVAARRLILDDGAYAPLDGFDLIDRGEPFQAVVRRLRSKDDDAPSQRLTKWFKAVTAWLRGEEDDQPNRWLIIVRDPSVANAKFTTAASRRAPRVTQGPSMLAAVVTYVRGDRTWRATVEELHEFDPVSVAELGLDVLTYVASLTGLRVDGATVQATLNDDGVTWDIRCEAPITPHQADVIKAKVAVELDELPVPVDVWVRGTSSDADGPDPTDEAVTGHCR